jgi:hypothetical protein
MFSKTVQAALILAATATGANAMTFTQDGHRYTVQLPERVADKLAQPVVLTTEATFFVPGTDVPLGIGPTWVMHFHK